MRALAYLQAPVASPGPLPHSVCACGGKHLILHKFPMVCLEPDRVLAGQEFRQLYVQDLEHDGQPFYSPAPQALVAHPVTHEKEAYLRDSSSPSSLRG